MEVFAGALTDKLNARETDKHFPALLPVMRSVKSVNAKRRNTYGKITLGCFTRPRSMPVGFGGTGNEYSS